jgi:hypothetical protein
MSSLRRINASRAHAALSRGPITPEGKARSSANAIRLGLLAKCVVLKNESGPCFDDLVAQHLERFTPADGVAFGIVEEMAMAGWRMRRARAIENRMMEKALCDQPPGDEAACIAAASPGLNCIHRYEALLHRSYQGGGLNLVLLRQLKLPHEPNPISEHHLTWIFTGSDSRSLPAPPDPGVADVPVLNCG